MAKQLLLPKICCGLVSVQIWRAIRGLGGEKGALRDHGSHEEGEMPPNQGRPGCHQLATSGVGIDRGAAPARERGGFLSFLGVVSYRIRILMYFDVSCMYPACIL